jgi:hypothetical protein
VLAKLLYLKAVLSIYQGDSKLAERCVRGISFLAGYIENEPVLISKLVYYEILEILCDSIEVCLNHVPSQEFSVSTSALLEEVLENPEQPLSLVNAVRGERVLGLAMFGLAGSQTREFAASRNLLVAAEAPWDEIDSRSRRAANIDKYFFLRAMSQFQSQITNEWPQRLNFSTHYEATYATGITNHYWVSAVAIPDFSFATLREGYVWARIQSLRLALKKDVRQGGPSGLIAVEAMGRDNPVAEEFLDPFTGKPFGFRLHGNHELIYSMGPNRKDDTAEILLRKQPHKSDDKITYRRFRP